uniref:Uncharacterized protein n=2 Tax=Aegilops tauschii subsp. strangulata TaxID=200361 RepID=A0A453Q2T9_AEGTS
MIGCNFMATDAEVVKTVWKRETFLVADIRAMLTSLLKGGMWLILNEYIMFQLSEALGKLYGQSRQGSSSDTVEPSKPRGGAHENCITCIVPLRKGSESIVKRFSTSGLDGKIVVWDLENHITIPK